jgi:Tfp pilus assembly protein PilP
MIHRSLLGVVLLCLSVPLTAQETLKVGTRVGMPASDYEGQSRRDPFAPLVSPPTPQAVGTVAAATRRAPGLAGMTAADVVLKGIISSGTTRMALLEGPDGKTYLARAQDRLHDAIIRRIDDDAVVLLTTATPRGAGRELRKPLRPLGEGGGL